MALTSHFSLPSTQITYTLSALDHWRKVIVGTVLLIAGIVTTSLLSKIDLRIK